jgi:hypothetical protein
MKKFYLSTPTDRILGIGFSLIMSAVMVLLVYVLRSNLPIMLLIGVFVALVLVILAIYVLNVGKAACIVEPGSCVLRITGAKKGRDSINNGIQWIQDLEIIIHPRCVNFLLEISLYSWKKDKFGKAMNVPEDDNNHLMDAMRYGLERFIVKNGWLI